MSSAIENSINAVRPSFILYADKLGEKVEELPIEEFEKRLNIRYSDSVDLSENIKLSQLQFEEEIVGKVSSSVLKQQVDELLTKGNTKLAIYNMGKLGYGAFAVKKIDKDEVIAVYAGTIIFGQTENPDDEGMRYAESNISISTGHHRGISSFLQHLPLKPMIEGSSTRSAFLKQKGKNKLILNEELTRTEFSSKKIGEMVATANVRKEFINYKGFPLIVLVANEVIKGIVGINYGYNYWDSRDCIPEYLDKKGNIIPHNLYRMTFGTLKFGHCSYIGEFNTLIETFLKKKVPKFKLTDVNNQKQIVTIEQLASALLQVRAMPRNEIEIYATLPKEDQSAKIDEKKVP